jgi:hypothetical protein
VLAEGDMTLRAALRDAVKRVRAPHGPGYVAVLALDGTLLANCGAREAGGAAGPLRRQGRSASPLRRVAFCRLLPFRGRPSRSRGKGAKGARNKHGMLRHELDGGSPA